MNKKESIKFPENILKNLFNKELNKTAVKELDSFIFQKLPKNDIENTIIQLSEEYVKELFNQDESKPYRNYIIKGGDLNPIFDMINIILKYNQENLDAIFILLNSIFKIYKDLNSKTIVEYTNKINEILRNNENLISKYINKLLEVAIILKIHFDSNVRGVGNILDNILQNTISKILKDKKKNKNFNSQDLMNKLLEKEGTNDTVIKLFVVNWIILICDIKQIQQIYILQDIIPWLFTLLNDNTEEIREIVKKCIMSIQDNLDKKYEEYYLENKSIYEKNLLLIIENCNSTGKSKEFIFERLNKYLNKFYNIMLRYIQSIEEYKSHANLTKKIFLNDSNIGRKKSVPVNYQINDNSKTSFNSLSHQSNIPISPIFKGITNIQNEMEEKEVSLNYKIEDSLKLIPFNLFINVIEVILNQNNEEYSKKTNELLIKIIEHVPKNTKEFDVKSFSNKIRNKINSEKLELIINWYEILFDKYGDSIFPNGKEFIDSFGKFLPNDNENLLKEMIYFLCDVGNYNETYFSNVIDRIINQLLDDKQLRDNFWEKIIKLLSKKLDIVKLFENLSESLLNTNNNKFIHEMVSKLNIFLITDISGKEVRKTLSKFGRNKNNEAKIFFDKLFTVWSYNAIAVLILTIISEYFELSFNLILNFTGIKLENEFYKELCLMVQLIETSQFNSIRIKLLEPIKNLYLVKSFYGILMLLPQGNAFDTLSNRMEGISTLYDFDNYNYENEENNSEEVKEEINYYLKIFKDIQNNIQNSNN